MVEALGRVHRKEAMADDEPRTKTRHIEEPFYSESARPNNHTQKMSKLYETNALCDEIEPLFRNMNTGAVSVWSKKDSSDFQPESLVTVCPLSVNCTT